MDILDLLIIAVLLLIAGSTLFALTYFDLKWTLERIESPDKKGFVLLFEMLSNDFGKVGLLIAGGLMILVGAVIIVTALVYTLLSL